MYSFNVLRNRLLHNLYQFRFVYEVMYDVYFIMIINESYVSSLALSPVEEKRTREREKGNNNNNNNFDEVREAWEILVKINGILLKVYRERKIT